MNFTSTGSVTELQREGRLPVVAFFRREPCACRGENRRDSGSLDDVRLPPSLPAAASTDQTVLHGGWRKGHFVQENFHLNPSNVHNNTDTTTFDNAATSLKKIQTFCHIFSCASFPLTCRDPSALGKMTHS